MRSDQPGDIPFFPCCQSRRMGHGFVHSAQCSLSFREEPNRGAPPSLGRLSSCGTLLLAFAPKTGSRRLLADRQASSLPLPTLTKPLRPFFIHPSTTIAPVIPPNAPFTPIICLSASRWVGGEDDIPSFTRLGDRTVAFEYVQGAGDDDELWARVSLASSGRPG